MDRLFERAEEEVGGLGGVGGGAGPEGLERLTESVKAGSGGEVRGKGLVEVGIDDRVGGAQARVGERVLGASVPANSEVGGFGAGAGGGGMARRGRSVASLGGAWLRVPLARQ